MDEYAGNLRRCSMVLKSCTLTNPNHHQYDGGYSSADRGTLGHLGDWTPGEILIQT